jgi:hypothetical protein
MIQQPVRHGAISQGCAGVTPKPELEDWPQARRVVEVFVGLRALPMAPKAGGTTPCANQNTATLPLFSSLKKTICKCPH